MWDMVLDLILLEVLDRLPKPFRIGCYVLMGLLIAVVIVWALLR